MHNTLRITVAPSLSPFESKPMPMREFRTEVTLSSRDLGYTSSEAKSRALDCLEDAWQTLEAD